MYEIYDYNEQDGFNPKFPNRKDLLKDINKDIDPSDCEEILFHAFDIANITKWKVYNQPVRGYAVIVTGVLEDGTRANLIIDQIPIYFDVKLEKKDNYYEKRQISEVIRNAMGTDAEKHEVVEKYPSIGFCESKHPYVRYYFDTQWERKKALQAIRSSKLKLKTANDVDGSLVSVVIIDNEWTIGDWSLIYNYTSEYDADKQLYNIFISDPEDFRPVRRPLSAEKEIVKTPSIPIYFHLPYDIEVNGTTDALPNVKNREEKIFMLSGGIYRSDKPDIPLISFTISHMQCMRDKYKEYMISTRRDKLMNDDKPDWVLILTESESDTILAYAEILGRTQPEFRSGFNSYSFDDNYVVGRIHQYKKLKTFSKKLEIIPYYYTAFGSEEKDKDQTQMFKRILLETHMKIDNVFDKNDNRHRLNYTGSINIDIMCAMKKLGSKDDLLTSHALKAYLERYGLPKKIDMSIPDMNKYYINKDALGLLEASDYCTVDALSCHRIANKVSLIQSYLTLAHLALCTPSDSALRAGGQKVKNVIYCFGNRMNINYSEYSVPERIQGKYPGATVFHPIRGRYIDVPTIALDFASLYPSIMRALWISSETYIDIDKKPKLVKRLKEEGYDLFEFNPKWTVEYKDVNNDTVIEEIDRNVCFVRKDPNGNELRGVYPKCLEFLTNIRKMYKKKMNKAMITVAGLEKEMEENRETEELKRKLFEARLEEKEFTQKQLAVKIVSNTLYGKCGSPSFALYNPFIAATITLMGRCLIKAASDRATEKGYKRLYGDTDSLFLIPAIEMMKGETDPSMKVKICQSLAVDELLPDILKEIRQITRTETNMVDMALDKLLYPCLFVGKKRYCGIIYEGDKKPTNYISGLEYVKRGRSKLLVELSERIVEKILDLNCRRKVIDIVVEVFKEGIDSVQKEPVNYFVMTAKYRTGKEGSLSLFIERMKQKVMLNPTLYELPEPNTTFEYIVTTQNHMILHNGNQRKLKVSDRMEFKHVVEKIPSLKPDYLYYVDTVMGALARFICFHDQFNEFDKELDSEDIDKKSNENAKKYLTEILKDYMGIKTIKHTIIKKQIKYINAEHTKQYGQLIHLLHLLFDGEVAEDYVCQFILQNCRNVPEITREFLDTTDYKVEIQKLEKYILSREGKLKGIYRRYINDIKIASGEEIEDYEIFNKSSKLSSSSKQILETIQQLKYANSIKKLVKQQKNGLMDILVKLLEI